MAATCCAVEEVTTLTNSITFLTSATANFIGVVKSNVRLAPSRLRNTPANEEEKVVHP